MPNHAHTATIAKAQAAYGRQARERLPTCGGGCIMIYDLDTQLLVVAPTACHKWTCAHCAPQRLREAQAKARSGHPERHIVLTMRPVDGLSQKLQITHCMASFRKLVARARRTFGTFEYMASLELHKNGSPHLHILQRGTYIPHRWLSQNWHALTGNYIVHLKHITNTRGAINELTKYLAKTAATMAAVTPRTTPITTSRGWVIDPPDVDPAHAEHNFLTFFTSVSIQDLETCLSTLGVSLLPARGPPGRFSLKPPPDLDPDFLTSQLHQAYHEEDRPMVLAVCLLQDDQYVLHQVALQDLNKDPEYRASLNPDRKPYSPGPGLPF